VLSAVQFAQRARAARSRALAWCLTAAATFMAAMVFGPSADIVRKAANIPEKADGLDGFVNAANALVTPALVAAVAVAPAGCIVGAIATMFGSRRGMILIGSALGTLVFLGSVKGIVA
jgi:hypothetical protein